MTSEKRTTSLQRADTICCHRKVGTGPIIFVVVIPVHACMPSPALPPKLRVCVKLKLRCVWGGGGGGGGGGGAKGPCLSTGLFKPSCASSVKLTINFQGHGVLSVTPILNNTMTFLMNGVILACQGVQKVLE